MLLDDLRAFARDPKGYPDSAAAHLCSNAADMIERLRASSHAQGDNACPWCGFSNGHHPWCRSPAQPASPHNTVLHPPAPLTPAACEQPDIDTLAQFIRDAEREHGQCDDDDTYISYRPTARAILQKFDVRPKHSSTVGGAK